MCVDWFNFSFIRSENQYNFSFIRFKNQYNFILQKYIMDLSFHNIVQSCHIKIHGTSKDIRESLKKLSKYVNINSNKDDILKLAVYLNKYKNNKNDQDNIEFKFRNKSIILNEEQQEIVFDDSRYHTRVIAGAGSGKTTTILCRIKYLLDNITTPDRILILTFNRSNCEDIQKKIKSLFGFEMKMDICTIDKFCNILKYRYSDTTDTDKINLGSLSELCIIGEDIMKQYGKEISNHYDYIFFDEFQDVNKQQFNILKIFADYGCVLTVIGDDNQNIYQFRGTDNFYIINLDKFVPNIQTRTLTTNYRSSHEIVTLANQSIKYNQHKIEKNMRALYISEKLPKLYLFKNVNDECQFIHQTIIRQKEKYNLSYDDFSILCRNGFPLKDFENYFVKIGIPCVTLLSNQNYDYSNKVSLMKNHLTISTVHSAKGLEWYSVFFVGLCDEHFPSHVNNNIKNIEEERRLFYVGVTRAKTNLYFIASKKDLPLSRFIKEVSKNQAGQEQYLEYKNKSGLEEIDELPRGCPPSDLFDIHDKNFAIDSYSVTSIIISLSGEDMDSMKKKKYIFDQILQDNVTTLYEEKLLFNPEITRKYLEADFGTFCDLVLTRQIMINSNQEIKDQNSLWILNGIELSDEEMEIYNLYELQKYSYLMEKTIVDIRSEKHKKIIQDIFNKINPRYEVRRQNTYPNYFLERLKEAYQIYSNPNMKNDDILRDIYYVSLCNQIKDNRRRLIYMNVFNTFMDGFDKINQRINNYAECIKNNKNKCKVSYSHQFKDSGYTMCGELDLLDETSNMIVDFKCSNNDIKLEWIIQVLLYYTLHYENKKKSIDKLGIFNIMDGKFYKIDIPKEYDYIPLLNNIEKIIHNTANSIRHTLMDYTGTIILDDSKKEGIKIKKIDYNIPNDDNNKNRDLGHTIILDVETNCEKGEIIQLAYMIFDENYQYVKSLNKYIKDRLASIRSFGVNGITNNILQNKGESFNDVMKEFIDDLDKCHCIVGHNIMSDCRVINKNYVPHYDLFENIKIYCTMKEGKYICNSKNINGHIKNPRLEELYQTLFKQQPNDYHDAMMDVKYTTECYFYINFTTQELIDIVKKMKIDNFCNIAMKVLNSKIGYKSSNNNKKTKILIGLPVQ